MGRDIYGSPVTLFFCPQQPVQWKTNGIACRPYGCMRSPGGLGGLEALVRAATEARRIGGEHRTPLEARGSVCIASSSPMLNRAPPLLSRPSKSPVLQKSPMVSSPHDTHVNPLIVISFCSDGEPSTKTSWRLDSVSSRPSRISVLHHSI